MASRNMEQIAQRAEKRIPVAFDVTTAEFNKLHAMIRSGLDGEWEAFKMLFAFGFAMGCRATRAGKVTGRL